MNITECFVSSAQNLYSKYGKICKSFLAFYLIIFLFVLLGGALGTLGIQEFITSIEMKINFDDLEMIIPIISVGISIFLLLPINAAFKKQLILIYNNQEVKTFDFLTFAANDFKIILKVFFRLIQKYLGVIFLLIASFASFLMVILSTIEIIVGKFEVFEIIAYTAFGAVGIWASIIWFFILNLKYVFTYNELAYNQEAKTGKEIVNNTIQNMKGKKRYLLLIYIIFLLFSLLIMSIAAIPFLGIILIALVVVPYIKFVMIAFYQIARGGNAPEIRIIEDINYENDNELNGPIQNI